jgi:hypothetical protein
MYQIKDLTELTVKDLWQEVKSEEDWWGDYRNGYYERSLCLFSQYGVIKALRVPRTRSGYTPKVLPDYQGRQADGIVLKVKRSG